VSKSPESKGNYPTMYKDVNRVANQGEIYRDRANMVWKTGGKDESTW